MVIGTPVYMGSMSSQCKAFLDRTLPFRRLSFNFRNRVGGVLAVGGSRNGGQELAIQAVHAAMLIHDMVVAGDGPDAAHFGGILWNPGDRGIASDEDGLKTARNLGKRVAELALKLNG
jgi:multimeric flavodoxin WrbA